MRRVLLLLLVAGCVTGPPPDWSEAREWRFPIVDPFDEDAVATIGYIDGHGPYVWFFDTGATFTTVDALVMQELNLHALAAGRVQEAGGHTDRIGVITDGQVKQWRIGSLQVRDPTFVVTRSHGTTYHGYRVAGVFGLASIKYLTIDIDRNAGWVRLALPGVIHPPEGEPASVYSSGGEIRLDVKFGNEEKEFVLDTYQGGTMEWDAESDETEPAFKFELTLRGSPQHAVEVEMEMLDENGLPIYAPFRFGVLLPAGEKPFSSPVEMALKGSLTKLTAALQAIKRARSVRIRDLRSYPIAVQKAATWVE